MHGQDELRSDAILDEASRRTGGLTDLGDGPFVEPLELVLDSIGREADLNDRGRLIARERMLLHTVNRLHYVHDRAVDPAIATQEIVRPVFIVGMPRTGTTILHDILAQDPATRAPLTWETMFPSPPPRAETFRTDPRIAACAALFPAHEEQLPEFKAIHPMGAELSQECVTMMGEAMCTPLFHNQFRVPAYQDWVDTEADFSHVYDLHRRQLQHLQAHNARDRWVLKTGAHLWGLPHLLATYPDARIVFTHRDPVKSMTSYASLTTLVRRVGSDSVDPAEVAADWTPRLRDKLLNAVRVRDADTHDDARFLDIRFTDFVRDKLLNAVRVREADTHGDARFLDIRFTDFVRDQFSVVEQIYDAFDLEMTPTGAAAMQAFIDDNPPGKHGVHEYTPEQFGLVPEQVRADFADYIDHFGLPPE